MHTYNKHKALESMCKYVHVLFLISLGGACSHTSYNCQPVVFSTPYHITYYVQMGRSCTGNVSPNPCEYQAPMGVYSVLQSWNPSLVWSYQGSFCSCTKRSCKVQNEATPCTLTTPRSSTARHQRSASSRHSPCGSHHQVREALPRSSTAGLPVVSPDGSTQWHQTPGPYWRAGSIHICHHYVGQIKAAVRYSMQKSVKYRPLAMTMSVLYTIWVFHQCHHCGGHGNTVAVWQYQLRAYMYIHIL